MQYQTTGLEQINEAAADEQFHPLRFESSKYNLLRMLMVKLLSTIVLAAFFLTLQAMTQAALAAENKEAFVYEIEMITSSSLRKLLEDHLDLYRLHGKERMNEKQLQRLIGLTPRQTADILATEGYYSPVTKVEMKYMDSEWLVKLDIDPGQAVRVSNVDISIQGPFNDAAEEASTRLDKIREVWELQTGDTFRNEDWESAKRSALKSLMINGYPTASIVESHATVNRESNSVALKLVLQSGALFTFGKLEISGLQRYPATLIERMYTIEAGSAYSQHKLLEFQSRLQDSPNFANADVSVALDPEHPTDVPVKAVVTENPSKKLGFGIGMSTDTGARGSIEYRDLDFRDRSWSFGSTLKLEERRQTWSNEVVLPLSASRYRDSFSAMFEHTDIEGLSTQKMIYGGKRTFLHDKYETSYGLRYFLEKQFVADALSSRSSALSPSYSWTLRNTDSLLYPTRGYSINFQADMATLSLLSDQDFIRGYTRTALYYPLNDNNQLSLRTELGMVAASSKNGIPSDFLFRTGGDQTIRGYAFQSLGVSEGSAVVGGRYLALASVEYVHWFSQKWGSGIFLDGGNAVDDPDQLSPVYGYGLGARWKSPVGPLNLDLAYGERVRATRLHFSLGFSF